MATRDIAIACQGGGSHAAFTGGALPVLLGEFDNLAVARAGRAGIHGDADVLVLDAISGTSGGAISALLGWYGFITGGAAQSRKRLDTFWDSNSATGIVEAALNQLARTLADVAGTWGFDIKTSPYALPLAGLELFNSAAWPAIANGLGPNNPFMRPDFFALPQLLQPCVDWPLVAALGEFASIPLDVQRWVRSDLEAAMYPPDAPCQERYRADRAHIGGRIEAKLGAFDRIRDHIDALGLADDALLRVAFSRWQAPPLRFERAALNGLATAVHGVTQCVPRLLIGAVELHQGDFVAFSSERAPDDGGVTIDAVLASAAVPWLFRAHEMAGLDPDSLAPRRLSLWDGLFSQNPPVRDFLSGVLDDAKKPDEIWVVQINPSQAKAQPGPHAAGRLLLSGGEIWDLRNALAGNLALNQELGFVDAINRRTEAAREPAPDDGGGDGHRRTRGGAMPQRRDKPVQVDRIVMDSDAVEAATGMTLGANSKLDRDPRLKDALCEHGRTQAGRYLALRRQVGTLCGEIGPTLAGACGSAAGIVPDGSDGGDGEADACRATLGRGALVIDGTTLYGARGGDPAIPRAVVRWRTVDAQVDGGPVRIEGNSILSDEADGGTEWRVQDVRITAVVPKPGTPAAPQPARRQKPRPGELRP